MKTSVEQFPYPVVEPEVVDAFVIWTPFIALVVIGLITAIILYFLKMSDMALPVIGFCVFAGLVSSMILDSGNDMNNAQASMRALDKTNKQVAASIEENYGVTVIELGGLSNSLRPVTVRTESALLTCTQQVTSDDMYSVFCGEGTVQAPLENVVTP